MDISRVKFNLNRIVIHNNAEYRLTGCILRMNKEGFYYEAELQDTKALNSTLICPLNAIKEIEIKGDFHGTERYSEYRGDVN